MEKKKETKEELFERYLEILETQNERWSPQTNDKVKKWLSGIWEHLNKYSKKPSTVITNELTNFILSLTHSLEDQIFMLMEIRDTLEKLGKESNEFFIPKHRFELTRKGGKS